MLNYESILIVVSYILILNFFFNKYDFIKDRNNSYIHKKFIKNKNRLPFSGGIFLLLTIYLFFSGDFLFNFLLFLIFLIGYSSDINYLKSPNIRFYVQALLVVLLVISTESYIQSIRIDFVDNLLPIFIFKLFFTTFCILILINGTNFLDGVNTLVIGYYLLILFFISKIFFDINSNIELSFLYIFIFTLITLFVLNCFNLLMLGDNGSYIISIFVGLYLIDLANENILISPYYIMNLLWYPAYENLFSILRKTLTKKSPLSPDNLHLHQLIYLFIKDRNISVKYVNSITGIIINIYNFIVFYYASNNYSNTKYQILLTLLSIIIYNFLYIFLKYKIKKY